ncbi:MAG: TetR/AcrR family transcriptional regulator [Thermoanaerobaculia bacterium]
MQKRHVGRPRGGDAVETRRRILIAAEECFAASGFVGATTRRVAALAGVNVATLHYHFESKEKLYRAVLDATTRDDVPFPGGGGTPEERLSSALEALWKFGVAHPALPRLRLFQGLAGPLFSAGIHEAPEDPRAALLVRTLTEAGVKTAIPPAETARVILALLDSALVAARGGDGSEAGSPSAVADASLAGVIAAALRVAGLA